MAPFRILVVGDFGAAAVSARPLLVDRDNFDQTMQRLDVRLEFGGTGVARFKELEDFHPDRLLRFLAPVSAPSEPRTTAAPAQPSAAPDAAATAAALSSGSLLDDIVEASQGPAGTVRKRDPLRSYVEAIVAPHLEPRTDPQEPSVDAVVAAQMRALLHAPRFQAVEAAWRGLDFLVRNTDTGTDLKIYVLHLPKKSLAGDLMPATDLRQTALYRLLVEETVGTPGGEPWGLIAANFTLGPSIDDVELTGRIALLAGAAGAPVIARADADLLGGAEELAAWTELSAIPEARYIGLALPGFLLRLPYGKDTSPIESFAFEEMPGEPKHSDYLWGNPAFACALLIAEAFSESGWDMRPGDALDITGLPAHVYKKDGESVMKPCAEVLMTESEAEALMERGLIPLLSMKGSDRVHVAGFRSIAGTPLGGRWS